MGRFSVHPSVRTSVHSPLWAIQPGLNPEAWLAGWVGLKPGWLGQTNKRDGKSLHSTGLCPLSGPLPKKGGWKKARKETWIKREECEEDEKEEKPLDLIENVFDSGITFFSFLNGVL